MIFNIYLITNLLNSKKYVGQTIGSIEKRFSRHCWLCTSKNNMPIAVAVKKYGKQNFKIELLEQVDTLEEANEKEVFWSLYYNTMSPNGYNLKVGGRVYFEMSQETKDKISKANKGRKISEKTRVRLSESHKGYKVLESTKKKLSEHFKNKKPHINTSMGASLKNAKPTLWLSPENKEVVVPNMRKFSQDYNISTASLHDMINNKNKIVKGWKFIKYL